MTSPGGASGLLTRAACWILIGAAMALALGSALHQADQETAHPATLGADLPLRFALGLYRLGGTETVDQTESWVGTPSNHPGQALQQALVVEVLRGPAVANNFLPAVETDLGAWLAARWQGDTATPPPDGFAAAAGRFAALAGTPATRNGLLARCALLVTGAALAAVVGAMAFALGCALLAMALWRWTSGRLWATPPDHPHTTAYLAAFAAYLGFYFLYAAVAPELVEGPARLAILWGFLVFVPLPLLVAQRLGARDIATAIGWHRGAGVFREIGCGVLGYCAGLPVILLGFVAMNWLSTWAPPASHPVEEMMGGEASLTVIILLFSLAAIFAPVIEEVFFRGVLLAHLRPRLGVPLAILVGAVVFAAVHPQGLAALPVLTAIGVVLGAIRCWRGSVIGSIAAHALHNGTLMVIMIVIAT